MTRLMTQRNPRRSDWRRTVAVVQATTLAVVAGLNLGVACHAAPAGHEPMTVVRLKCEDAADPLGVDVPNPRVSWQLRSTRRGARQTAYRVIAASRLDKLAAGQGDLWDSGRVDSDASFAVRYAGEKLTSSQLVYWKVQSWDEAGQATPWSEPARWTMGIVDPADWKAVWIVAPWTSEALLLRHEFDVKPGLKRATAHLTGLGQFEFFLNGRKASDNLLSPGWTKYNRTCLYETHDVTTLLKPGRNAVGLALGDGMYNTERRNRFSKFQGSFGPLRAFGQIELEYEDGSREVVATRPGWRVTRGPVTYNDIYGGEDYDARLEEPGWSTAGFDDGPWTDAVELVRGSNDLKGLSASAPPLRPIETIKPAAITTVGESQVVDFGQNASYMPRITVTGPAGSTVRLTHAEVVDEQGRIDRGTCGGNRGPAYWQYTKRSAEPETWFPQFFYAGCRYLQVDCLPATPGGAKPKLDRCEGVVVHSSAAPLGEFACSSDLLNRIRTLVRWAQRSNMVSVLTDCPHREKLGWLEQYHLNGPAIRYEFDTARIFAKGMQDMADSQLENGLVPNIAPEYTAFPGTFRAAAEWGSAVILVPWQHYQFTGDAALLERFYPQMERYFAYLDSIADDGIVSEGLGDWYDVSPEGKPGFSYLSPPPITASAFFVHDAELLTKIARLLGKDGDAVKFAKRAGELRSAWLAKFHNADGTYATNSQCSNALALEMGLAEPADRAAVMRSLVADLAARNDAPTAGDVGHRYLLQALARNGRSDLVFRMVNQDERPGYGYQLKHGATSLTEAWDANHQSSHNHFMLGHITEWLYGDVLGIRPDAAAPGFKRVVVAPTPVGDLAWAEGSYEGPFGKIAVRWERKGESFRLKLEVPANSTAVVELPPHVAGSVREGNGVIDGSRGVQMARDGQDAATQRLLVNSGVYDIRCELSPKQIAK